MIVPKELVVEARKKLGDEAAEIISQDLKIEGWDSKNLKGRCPFHDEETASFVWNSKEKFFKCFGCSKVYGILNHYMKFNGLTYLESLEKLFEQTNTEFNFNEKGIKQKRDYRYPFYDKEEDRSKTESYLATRKISKETLDYCDIQQSKNSIVFNFYDENDVLTLVKYRPAKPVQKHENKSWCQKDADTKNILFNMNRIDPTKPLILVEGEIDCLSVIESGELNCVSIPLGAGNIRWIEENWEWLEQFEKLVVWFDSDEPGQKARKETCQRLGIYKTLYVEIPDDLMFYSAKPQRKCKDANEILFDYGPEKVLELISSAQEMPLVGAVDLSSVEEFDIEKAPGLYTGLEDINNIVYKFLFGNVVVVTGQRGCVDADTEFFNGKQWKRIADYSPEDYVLQYHEDGSATLTIPTQYHKYPADYLWKFETQYGLNQCLSEDHNMVYFSSKGNLVKRPLSDVMGRYLNGNQSGYVEIPTVFEYGGAGLEYDDITIRLLVASICDGSYYYHIKSKDAPSYNRCRFHLKKDRKKDRLESLLKSSDFLWRKIESANEGYTDYYVDLPLRIKEFDSSWYSSSHEQLLAISEECLFWDGTISSDRKSFSTTNKTNADFIQFAFESTGRSATIRKYDRRGQKRGKYARKSIEYTVSISDRKYRTFNHDLDKEQREDFFKKYKTVDGYQYCFSVPSEMLVLRREGDVFVTGNSGKSTLLNQIFLCDTLQNGQDAFIFSGELAPPILKSWLELTMAGPEHTKMKDGSKFVHIIEKEAKVAMRQWYENRIWIYNQKSNSAKDILDVAVATIRKYGAKVLILDNLSTIDIGANDNNLNEKQKWFMVELVNLAALYGVLFVLVVHPRKTMAGVELNSDDVGGSGAITNLAQYVLSVKRFSKKEKQGTKDNKGAWKKGMEPIDEDVEINVMKNRHSGKIDSARFFFHYESYRFWKKIDELYKRYKWDSTNKNPVPTKNPRQDSPFGD